MTLAGGLLQLQSLGVWLQARLLWVGVVFGLLILLKLGITAWWTRPTKSTSQGYGSARWASYSDERQAGLHKGYGVMIGWREVTWRDRFYGSRDTDTPL